VNPPNELFLSISSCHLRKELNSFRKSNILLWISVAMEEVFVKVCDVTNDLLFIIFIPSYGNTYRISDQHYLSTIHNNLSLTNYSLDVNLLRTRGCWQVLRPERKPATATKLGIFSAYTSRSSIHFLARCSNFCKPLKKIQKLVRPTGSTRQQWPQCRTKNGDISIVFSDQGTGGSPTGRDPDNRVVIKTMESHVR